MNDSLTWSLYSAQVAEYSQLSFSDSWKFSVSMYVYVYSSLWVWIKLRSCGKEERQEYDDETKGRNNRTADIVHIIYILIGNEYFSNVYLPRKQVLHII